MKHCWDCKGTLELSLFFKDKSRKDGYGHRCKECVKAYNQSRKTHIAKLAKNRYQSNPELGRKKANEYYHNNIERCRTTALRWKYNNKDKVKASEARYRKNNPEKMEWDLSQRRKSVEQATVKWTNKKLVSKIYRLRSRLNKIAGYVKYHVDHQIPLNGKNISGLHVENNLRISLATENLLKGNKV
jgi:hypothetical protein